MNRTCILVSFLIGLVLTFAVVVLTPYWWPWFWIPFLGATVLLYPVCRAFPEHPLQAGFAASLPGLLVPIGLWWMVLWMWQPVDEARVEGGLYCIMTLGDPHSIVTILQFLVLPVALVLSSGFIAGALAALVGRFTDGKGLVSHL